jgi:RNA polymerase sporulation-specific sigma factor
MDKLSKLGGLTMDFNTMIENNDYDAIMKKTREITSQKLSKTTMKFPGMDKEDIYQEVSIKIFKILKKYDPTIARASTFFDHAIDNQILDCYRVSNKKYNDHLSLPEEESPLLVEKENGFSKVELTIDILESKIMTPLEKKIFLYKQCGLRSVDIAKTLDYSPSRVTQIWNSVKKKLKKILA